MASTTFSNILFSFPFFLSIVASSLRTFNYVNILNARAQMCIRILVILEILSQALLVISVHPKSLAWTCYRLVYQSAEDPLRSCRPSR